MTSFTGGNYVDIIKAYRFRGIVVYPDFYFKEALMCRKKRRKVLKAPKATPPKRSLESCIEKFDIECDRCHSPLVVHGYRAKSYNSREKIYAHCENNGENAPGVGIGNSRCPKYNAEICFIEKFF